MDVWHLIIIAGATILALKCLSSLMVSHRMIRFDEQVHELEEQIRAEQNTQEARAASLLAVAEQELKTKAPQPAAQQRKAA